MVTGSIQKHLGLVLHAPKRARMNDACAITLKFRPIGMARLGIFPPAGVTRFFGKRREHGALARFHFFACFAEGREARHPRIRRMLRHN